MSSIQFYRLKCTKCGSKFTITTEQSCDGCKFLGVQCQHRLYCFSCYKSLLRGGLFYSTAIAIVLVAMNALGGRING